MCLFVCLLTCFNLFFVGYRLTDNWPAIKAVLHANHITSKEIARMRVEYQKMHAVASRYCRGILSSPSSQRAGTSTSNNPFMLDLTSLECPSPSHDALFPAEDFSSDEEMFASFS